MSGFKIDLDHFDIINNKIIWKHRNSDKEERLISKVVSGSLGLLIYIIFVLIISNKYSNNDNYFTNGILFFLCLFYIFFYIIPITIILIVIRAKKRKIYSEYQNICLKWAEYLNLEYQTDEPKGASSSLQFILEEYSHFHIFFPDGYIYDMMKGKLGIYHIKLIDYSYRTERNEKKTYHNWTILLVDFDFNVFPLVILPKRSYSLKRKLKIKGKSVKVEFDDFNQVFDLYGENKRFTFDIIHPRMMEYLLQYEEIKISLIEMNRRSMIIVHGGFIYKSHLPSFLKFAQGFLEKIPGYILDSKQQSKSNSN